MWKLIRKPIFTLPAEPAHHLGLSFLKSHAIGGSHRTFPLQLNPSKPNFLEVINPVGLAAGLDKNCEIITELPALGFGFAEIGTVTPRPQGGNDKPRMFRDIPAETIFNRMGFNNLGAGIISERLRLSKPKLPKNFKVGVNLGKNKLTPDARAAEDYASVAESFKDCADYYVINVSSPNTPGLRALQSLEALIPIVKAVNQVANLAQETKIPVLVKLAPELTSHHESFKELLSGLEEQSIEGLVLTNTLQGQYIYRGKTMTGGWSGRCLTEKSFESLQFAKKNCKLPIISVGGIDSPAEARRRLDAGASLVQIYTAWIYEGPYFARTIIRALAKERTYPAKIKGE